MSLAELIANSGRQAAEPEEERSNPSAPSHGGGKATPGRLNQGGTSFQGMKAGGAPKVPALTWSLAGPQVIARQAVGEFKITCRDKSNQTHEFDAANLEAKMWKEGDKRSEFMGTITRQNKGVFIIQFRPRETGVHHFNIWVKGALEKKSIYDENDPVVLKVIEEDTTLVKESLYFSIQGKGLVGGEVGYDTSFEISVTGADKRPRDVDASKLAVSVVGSGGKLNAYCEKVATGKYQTDYKPIAAGPHTVHVTYGGQEVCNSQVTYDNGVDPSKCCILEPPIHVRVGQQATFAIDTKTESGKRLTRGGEKFDVGVSGPSGGVQGLVVRDEQTGSYTVRFTLVLPGVFKFFISLREVALDGSPFEVVAK